MNKKKIIATGAIVAVLGASILGLANNNFKKQEEPNITAFKVVSLSLYSTGLAFDKEINSENVQIYCDFDEGLTYTDYTKKTNKIIDGEHLTEELVERDIVYSIIGGEYYTKNGENLIEATVERKYAATKAEREDGTYFYMAPWGGTVVGDQVIYQQKMYLLESEEMSLPIGYTLISIDNIIPTKSYNLLNNKDLCNEGKETNLILK